MMKLAIAGFAAAAVSCSGAYAQEPITLNDLFVELEKLRATVGDQYLEELSIVIAPQGVMPRVVGPIQVSKPNEHGETIVTLSHNGQHCPLPTDLRLLREYGFYIIEFCQGVDGDYAWGDIHELADGAANLGGFVDSDKFECERPADRLMMTQRARRSFCAEIP